jgi:hypothetical protein
VEEEIEGRGELHRLLLLANCPDKEAKCTKESQCLVLETLCLILGGPPLPIFGPRKQLYQDSMRSTSR